MKFLDYNHHCFACGELNPHSLRLKFSLDGNIVTTVFTPGDCHQGYPGIMHGGIASTLLDEVMSNSIVAIGLRAFTGRLEVRFRQNIPLHSPIRVEGWVTKRKGRVIDTEGRILLENGEIATESTARFMIIEASLA